MYSKEIEELTAKAQAEEEAKDREHAKVILDQCKEKIKEAAAKGHKDVFFECLKAPPEGRPVWSPFRKESLAGKELVEQWLKEEGFRYEYCKYAKYPAGVREIGTFHIEWGEKEKSTEPMNPETAGAISFAFLLLGIVAIISGILFFR